MAAAGVGTALALALSSGNAGSGNAAGPPGGTSPSVTASGASGTGAGTVVQNVRVTNYEDGIFKNSTPATLATVVPFLCSGNTLSESSPKGVSDQYTRVAGNP